ncbi:MAG: hypothetical protein NVS3B10_00440 [Polyangiales bacterium]
MERAIGRLASVLECVRAEGYAAARGRGDAGDVIDAGVERGLATGASSAGERAARRVMRELGLVAIAPEVVAAVRRARAKDGGAIAATLYDGGVSTEYGEACAELAEAVEAALATPDRADLPALLDAARGRTMTPAEREEQVRSFAAGNVGLSNPAVTREAVDRVAEAMAMKGTR